MTEMSAAEAATVAGFDAAEPAPESWGGLREAVAEAIFDNHPMSRWGAKNLADAVLALPEVAALRAKANAADRALEVLDALSRETGAYEASYKGWAQQVIRDVRRALDGADQTDRGRC